MNRRIKVTEAKLREAFGIPASWPIGLGLPCGAPVTGEETVRLLIDVEVPSETAPAAKETQEDEA